MKFESALRRPVSDRHDGPAGADDLPDEAEIKAIRMLHATLLALVRRDGRDLTSRQLAVLMTVYLDARVHTVSSMAEMLKVSRPGVTRILDRLIGHRLVEREEDRFDRRRVLIRRTGPGTRFMGELAILATGNGRAGQPRPL
jgi:DNA-binding MarR family transcriptional regulator